MDDAIHIFSVESKVRGLVPANLGFDETCSSIWRRALRLYTAAIPVWY